MMAALGLDVGANLTAEERFKQVAAVMKRRDAQDRKEQRQLRRQQKLDKKVNWLIPALPVRLKHDINVHHARFKTCLAKVK